MLCDDVVFAEIRSPKPKKKSNLCMFLVRFWFGFGVYVKALIGFKAFYFFFGFGFNVYLKWP